MAEKTYMGEFGLAPGIWRLSRLVARIRRSDFSARLKLLQNSADVKAMRFALPSRLIFLLLGITTCGGAAERAVRVGLNHSPPYCLIGSDGVPRGFVVEVIREAARRSGTDVELVVAPEGPDAALAAGLADVFPLVTDIPERQGRIFFTDPWMRTRYVLLTRRGTPIRDAAAAAGYRVSHGDSKLNARLARTLFPRSRLVAAPLGEELAGVCSGSADAALVETKEMLTRLLERPAACRDANIDLIPLRDASYQMAIGSSRAGIERARVLRSAIGDMAQDLTLDRLYRQWLHDTGDETAIVNELIDVRRRNVLLGWAIGFLAAAIGLLTWLIYRKKTTQRAIRSAYDFVSAVLDKAGGPVLITNREGVIVRVNQACEAATGMALAEMEGKTTWELFVPPEEAAQAQALHRQLATGHATVSDEHHWRTRNGVRLFSWSYSVLTDAAGRVEYIVRTGADISHREAAEKKLICEAALDPLTNLLNRRGFSREMDRAIACAREGIPLRLGVADLDWFKDVNDTFGHAAGDEVLCFFADLLRDAVGEGGVAARLGGDEFCFVLCGLAQEFSLARIRQKMNDKEFRSADGRTFRAGASFGIALWHSEMKNASDLLEAADQALYEAKAASRSRRGAANREMALVAS